jgi:hypothetical protein
MRLPFVQASHNTGIQSIFVHARPKFAIDTNFRTYKVLEAGVDVWGQHGQRGRNSSIP